MESLILTLHLIVCVLLVILILLQAGKEGMGVIFGGGNSSLFGSTGAGGILVKLTTFMALVFVVTCLSYTYVTSSRTTTESPILDVQIEEVQPQAPQETKKEAPAEQAAPKNAVEKAQPKEAATPQEPNTQTPAAPAAKE